MVKPTIMNEFRGFTAYDVVVRRENWAFLTQYDPKGEVKASQKVPENASFYGDKVPATTSQQIGSRLNSPLQRKLKQLESSMSKHSQKSDLNTRCIFT